jgi:tetratricopeptide (TPR) repeat protein
VGAARAAAIRSRLTQEHPEEEGYQVALTEDYVSLGLICANTERRAEAVAAYEKVESLLRPLIARHPDDVRQPLALAAAETNWGLFLLARGQPEAGFARCTEAVELAEAALRREPNHFMARPFALNAHGARAQNYEALGRWADAVKDWDRIVELEEPPNRWWQRLFRATALARAGAYARAAAEAEELAAEPKMQPDGHYQLACIYAVAAGPAGSDATLPASERTTLAERYAARAVAVLQELQARGYFKDPAHAEALRTDTELQPLRDRADFQPLLAGARPDKPE